MGRIAAGQCKTYCGPCSFVQNLQTVWHLNSSQQRAVLSVWQLASSSPHCQKYHNLSSDSSLFVSASIVATRMGFLKAQFQIVLTVNDTGRASDLQSAFRGAFSCAKRDHCSVYLQSPIFISFDLTKKARLLIITIYSLLDFEYVMQVL